MFPKILVFNGSVRPGSYNARLAARIIKELVRLDTDVTWISLIDYPLPMFNDDVEHDTSLPENALNLKRLFMAHHGIFIVCSEYNASIPPIIMNAIDWISRIRERNEPPLIAFRRCIFALGSASDGDSGGAHSLSALRQILTTGCGAEVLHDQITVPHAHAAFDSVDNLVDEKLDLQLQRVTHGLVKAAQDYAQGSAA